MRPHPDEGTLALHALGEPALTAEDAEHVRTCATCRVTVEELARTVDVVRGPRARDLDPVPVPPHVWQGVAAELGLGAGTVPRPDHGPDPSPVPDAGASAPAVPPAPRRDDELAVRRRTGGRGRRVGPWAVAAAAAVGVVVGAVGVVAARGLPGGAGAPGPGGDAAVLAAADLEEFGAGAGSGAAGLARLVQPTGAPGPVLQVWLDGLPDTGDDFLEAWLIDPDTGAMVSLGPVVPQQPGDATADLTVPSGLDVGRFALVDVSAEPTDGDPTHSGASLLRGALEL
ncbi:anti-sigma factor domain-containing protein [Aquipuribacter nitratireducens]|uniref:Anti-sigma factor domain-containing protein n=1 Tax=Aquipuribacter nitratireducens TaxID=650104 RepID=A0ABW0GIC8_9MICO